MSSCGFVKARILMLDSIYDLRSCCVHARAIFLPHLSCRPRGSEPESPGWPLLYERPGFWVRVVRNVGWIERRRKTGRLLVLAGLVFLGGSFLLTFYQNNILLSYVGLILGFLTFNGGMQQVARWSRKPRTDQILDELLSRLNERFAIVHYPALPGRRPDHVIVAPSGTVVVTPREVGGSVSLEGRRWRRGSALRQIFNLGGPQLGNPTVDNDQQVASVEAFFEQEELSADVHGVVVFIHPDVEIEMRDPESTVLHITELYDYIRDMSSDTPLASQDRSRLVNALAVGEEIEETGSPNRRPRKKVRAA